LVATFLSVSYRHSTTGYRGYRRGSSVGGSLAVQLPIGRRSVFLLGVDASYSIAAVLSQGVAAPDTGGLLLAAAPGVLFALRPDWLLRLSLQVPVIERWRGQQQESASGVLSLVVDL
jgi:hypothetical protein